ncbi:putative hydrolase [Lachnellula hyalina]|uniref:Putative hydrolase n=1 Tax=Lachnellula hyalina TaxID=1316788 RepID=A0A8H8QWL4_9HELO|nr:putative hydrolase [Lachnellula hyalina]TVY24033.1 putative hydrolase [Lachnellula hyalina]
MSKLRILCLHGFTSNGSVHAHQVRHLTSSLSNDFDFLFPDGPEKVSLSSHMDPSKAAAKAWVDYVSANSSGAGHRAWWFARDPDPVTKSPGGFEGLEKSLKSIGELIQRTGPVHAIWGFSQGACFAGMLVALLGEKNREHPMRVHFPKEQGTPAAGIFFSGFKARFGQYDSIYAPGIEIPTMHVMGKKDTAVSMESSEGLVRVCQGAKVLKHLGGHDVPSSEGDREIIVNFLGEILRRNGKESL